MSEMPTLAPFMLAGLTWPQAKQQMRLTGCAVRRNHWCAPVVRLINGKPALDDEGEIVEAEFLPTIDDAKASDWAMTEKPRRESPMSQQQPPTLKAWVVHDGDESSAIVYAATRGQARSKGTGALDTEFVCVEARRAAKWDALAPHGPSNEQLFDAGWWFECDCGGQARAGDGEATCEGGQFYCHDCAVSRHSPDAASGDVA